MRYGSVCSGIEAATVAWHPLGWRAAWYSEIEPFPCAVLAHHYNGVSNLGDMTKITEWDLSEHGAIDVLVGGTPCQSFSVAGLRGGLADPRGNLALRFLQLAGVLRPKWVVWENVPGVRSSGEGRDFATFLGGLGQLGYWWAYRSLDAQYFKLAQRRERVFVVGHLGDWRRAAAVLFERDCLSGNPPPSREPGEDATGSIGDGLARCLTAGEAKRQDWETRNFVTTQITSPQYRSTPAPGRPCHTLAGGAHPPAIAFSCKDHAADAGPVSTTLRAMGHGETHANAGGQVAVALAVRTSQTSANGHGVAQDVAHTLDSAPHQAVQAGMAVRRLTPRECERLQGFPDDYTRIPWRKKPAELCPDGPRYKAIGNSMAVPVMRWIGRRMQQVSETTV